MARINATELRYMLTLNPDTFLATLKKTEGQVIASRQKVEKPYYLRADAKGVLDQLSRIGLAFQGLRTVIEPLRQVNTAFLDQEKSIRRVEAAAKLTGTGLAALQGSAAQIKEAFQLTTEQANSFTVAANALTTAAGDTSKTGDVLKALFDLAAGQGLNASEALLRFEQAIKGVDEGTEALFSGKNPIDVYREYGEAIGKTATALTEQEKKQAIANAIMRDGSKLQGEYNKFLQSAAGAQQKSANQVAELRAELGELVSSGLVPILQVANPILTAFNKMDAGTRNAGVALIGFIAVTAKARTAFLALRTSILALNASLGPAGWIILGLSAAATAITIFASSGDDATESMSNLNREFSTGAQAAGDFKGEISETTKILTGLTDEIDKWRYQKIIQEQFLLQGQLKTLTQGTTEYANALQKFNVLEAERLALRAKAGVTDAGGAVANLTEKELEALDKLREYQLQTGRISLAQYVAYLESRQAAVKEKLGAENMEYLKFADNLSRLQAQVQAGTRLGDLETPALSVRTPDGEALAKPFAELREIQTEFKAETFADLEEEYNSRLLYSNLNLAIAEDVYTRESAIYEQEAKKREEIEKNFQAAKIALARQGAAAVLDLTAQFATAFQGTSRALFEVGKAASIAQAVINTYEGATKAIAKYPPPFNAIAAAATLALGFAQVAKIKATEFQAKGFATGTRQPLTQADLIQSLFTPPGEDGIVGVRRGEYIVNADRTKEFADILEAINAGALRREDLPAFRQGGMVQFTEGQPGQNIPAYQQGGTVKNVTNIQAGSPVIAPGVSLDALNDKFERLVEAVQNVKIEIRSELDALQFFRKHYPNYERDVRKRRI